MSSPPGVEAFYESEEPENLEKATIGLLITFILVISGALVLTGIKFSRIRTRFGFSIPALLVVSTVCYIIEYSIGAAFKAERIGLSYISGDIVALVHTRNWTGLSLPILLTAYILLSTRPTVETQSLVWKRMNWGFWAVYIILVFVGRVLISVQISWNHDPEFTDLDKYSSLIDSIQNLEKSTVALFVILVFSVAYYTRRLFRATGVLRVGSVSMNGFSDRELAQISISSYPAIQRYITLLVTPFMVINAILNIVITVFRYNSDDAYAQDSSSLSYHRYHFTMMVLTHLVYVAAVWNIVLLLIRATKEPKESKA